MTNLDPETLLELRTAREMVIEAMAIANEKEAAFRSLVARTLKNLGQPIEKSVICLDCGEIRQQRTDHTCPANVDDKPNGAGKS